MARLMKHYQEIIPQLKEAIGRDNLLSLPKMEKIVINMGVGKTIENKRRLECAVQDLTLISGQKPVITKARNSIAGFKIREGQNLGCKVTLRQARMFEFYDRLINIVIPRIRDFRGLSPKSFDGRGNYSMGITEQAVFPEIRDDKIDFAQGMDITIVIKNARSNQEAYSLLELMGMPFAKPKTKSKKK